MTGWLINDTLTCIPDTKTFWHDLLEWFPELQDKTGGYTPFSQLATTIEEHLRRGKKPDFIIRNATFFRRINTDVPTISYLQDSYSDDKFWQQIEVCNNSKLTVFNSSFVRDLYADKIKGESCVIKIGTDFEHFCKSKQQNLDILPRSILYVGSSDVATKGFNVIKNLIQNTEYNFCLVMKHKYDFEHPRVKVFNNVDHDMLKSIYNQCSLLLCPSNVETLHLAGIEAGACEVPIVANKVGIYNDLKSDSRWGHLVSDGDYKSAIEAVLKNTARYNPRQSFLDAGLDKETCREKWTKIIKEVKNNE